MLGHKLVQRLGTRFEVAGTVRGATADYAGLPALSGTRLMPGVKAEAPASVVSALDAVEPEAVINCIGVVKQLKEAKDPLTAITVNALFPHQLARFCAERGARLIHFSTDCVFSGRRGNYSEDDVPDPEDLYGRTKLLGEVAGPGCLTLRTSLIGRELRGRTSLIEWFLAQEGGRVQGFARAFYSGLTVNAMADLVAELLTDFPALDGLWHASADPISKYDLLKIVDRIYGLGIMIERDESLFCDRRLDSSRFRAQTGFRPKPWEEMIAEMHADPTPYARPCNTPKERDKR